jgi:hypothetical protein
LSNPNNAAIGNPGIKTLTIVDDDGTATTYSVSLVKDWNLISLPITPEDSDISSIFPADVVGSIVDIWGWDEARQDWVYYSPDPNDYYYQYYPKLTDLEAGKAYWIEMSSPATFTVSGTVPGIAPKSPTTLGSRWNFVGLTGLAWSTPVAMYPGAIDVWGWDEVRQDWVYYSPNSNDYYYQSYPKINNIKPGHGYWVEML